MQRLYVLTTLLALGCGDGDTTYAAAVAPDGEAGSSGTYQSEAGQGSETTGALEPTGGSPGGAALTGGTGGLEPTAGSDPAGGSTGGLESTGGSPTGGAEGSTGGIGAGGATGTGGVSAEGITCEASTCQPGVACCFPYPSQEPYCASTSESIRDCGFGYVYQGLLAECTSPNDCDEGQHCCLYYEPLAGGREFPHHSECGTCSDGQGNSRICEADEDCASGRTCRVNEDLNTTTIKTCRGT